ncbi:MAG: cohesin domain-containing protein [Candidatus Wolfebacteria bacterium]|nr:cohesin domain-containing protein [Candidatus Wolfebacteria bacterium]
MNNGLRDMAYKFLFKAFLLLGFIFLIHNSLSLIPLANAAELKLDSSQKEVGAGQQIEVALTLDSQNQILNALEAKIFWSDNLEFISVNEGDSIVGLWVQRPELKDNQIFFSGIMPGGYRGVQSSAWQGVQPGEVLRMVFQAKEIGLAKIFLNNARVLLNNGTGTEAKLTVRGLNLNIGEKPGQVFTEKADNIPPEEFFPDMANDPNIFSGKWFLIFKARDFGSGIGHYEILEDYPLFYFKNIFFWQRNNSITAESPYVLLRQDLKSRITVKAVDKSGNFRVAVMEPRNPLQWYENYLVWCAIIIVGFVAYFIIRRRI